MTGVVNRVRTWLIASQILTLFTTPVIYLAFDRLGRWVRGDAATP